MLVISYAFSDSVIGRRAMVYFVVLMWAPFLGAGLVLWFRRGRDGVAQRSILRPYAIWASLGTLAMVATVLFRGRWAFTGVVVLSVVVPVLVPMLRMVAHVRSPGVE